MKSFLHKTKSKGAVTLFGKSNKRYFVLDDENFSYFKDDKAKKAKKSFSVADIDSVSKEDKPTVNIKGFEYGIKVVIKGRDYLLYAAD